MRGSWVFVIPVRPERRHGKAERDAHIATLPTLLPSCQSQPQAYLRCDGVCPHVPKIEFLRQIRSIMSFSLVPIQCMSSFYKNENMFG